MSDPTRCRHQCPGGAQCICNAMVHHALHVCANPCCSCHSQERYEERWLDPAHVAPIKKSPAVGASPSKPLRGVRQSDG